MRNGCSYIIALQFLSHSQARTSGSELLCKVLPSPSGTICTVRTGGAGDRAALQPPLCMTVYTLKSTSVSTAFIGSTCSVITLHQGILSCFLGSILVHLLEPPRLLDSDLHFCNLKSSWILPLPHIHLAEIAFYEIHHHCVQH